MRPAYYGGKNRIGRPGSREKEIGFKKERKKERKIDGDEDKDDNNSSRAHKCTRAEPATVSNAQLHAADRPRRRTQWGSQTENVAENVPFADFESGK